MRSLKQQADTLCRDIRLLYGVLRHPQSPWRCKLVSAIALGYIFSPVQLLPNFIPVVGQADDVLVLYLAVKLLRVITPRETLSQYRLVPSRGQDDTDHDINPTVPPTLLPHSPPPHALGEPVRRGMV
jgi:uncharacterized membrane protein YkvA (DUF1232 family)